LLRWIAFLWGCLAVAVMTHYALRWFPDVGDPRKNEMAMGFAFGAFYGLPAWLSFPVFVFAQWQELKPLHRCVLLLPVALALVLWIVSWWMSRA
jgi:hypothetical protein